MYVSQCSHLSLKGQHDFVGYLSVVYIYIYKFNGGLGQICYKFIFQSLNELWGERLCCKTFFYGYCKARNCLKFNNICFVGLKIAKMINMHTVSLDIFQQYQRGSGGRGDGLGRL
jgi:hypothetical protein